MKLVGSQDPPFLRLRLTGLVDLRATVASGRPTLVLAGRRARRFLEFIDAVDGSTIGSIDIGDWAVSSDVRMRVIEGDGQPTLFTAFSHGVRQWSIPDGAVIAQWKPPGVGGAVDIDRRGEVTVALMIIGDSVRQLDATTGREVGERLRAREGGRWLGTSAELVSVAAAGRYVFAGDTDGHLWRWEAAAGRPADVWRAAHADRILTVFAYPAGGRTVLATTAWDRTLRLWDADTGERVGADIGLRAMEVPRVTRVPAAGPIRELVVVGDDAMWRVDAATGTPGPVIARWETDDGRPRTDDDPDLDEVCALAVGGRDFAFVATEEAIWRLSVESGTDSPP